MHWDHESQRIEDENEDEEELEEEKEEEDDATQVKSRAPSGVGQLAPPVLF
jgi:hypothetical protein